MKIETKNFEKMKIPKKLVSALCTASIPANPPLSIGRRFTTLFGVLNLSILLYGKFVWVEPNPVICMHAIVTPDDVGCLVEDIEQLANFMTRGKQSLKIEELDEILDLLTTRPRQNVVFELGLFIGVLGRDKVCYLLQKDVQDELSDLHGILHKSFDKSVEEVFHEIANELKED